MGPRAMLASGVVGAGLGMTEGCLTWALLKISGETVEQRWVNFVLSFWLVNVWSHCANTGFVKCSAAKVSLGYQQPAGLLLTLFLPLQVLAKSKVNATHILIQKIN